MNPKRSWRASLLLARRDEATERDAPGAALNLGEQVELLEGRLLRLALERAGGNRTLAARLLGVSRNGLAIKIKRLGTLD